MFLCWYIFFYELHGLNAIMHITKTLLLLAVDSFWKTYGQEALFTFHAVHTRLKINTLYGQNLTILNALLNLANQKLANADIFCLSSLLNCSDDRRINIERSWRQIKIVKILRKVPNVDFISYLYIKALNNKFFASGQVVLLCMFTDCERGDFSDVCCAYSLSVNDF